MEDDNYTVAFRNLRSPTNKRDPRMIRLAAVAAAISDVVGGDSSAAKVYAATLSALEGTLNLDPQKAPLELHDSLSTQVALFELLRLTIPFVSNPAILDASLALSSRVLRGILSSSLGLDTPEIQKQLETRDDLGGINAVLRALCRACTELFKQLTPKADATLVKQCFGGTLMGLFDDRRPKVRKAAQNGILEVLVTQSSKKCHPTIVKTVNSFCHNQLKSSLKNVNKGAEPQTELLHLLSFLERTISHLDVTTLGTDIMEQLAALLKLQSSSTDQPDYVANRPANKDSEPKLFAINALLSAVKELLENNNPERPEKSANALCPRILATLLQHKPNLVFQEGSAADLDLLRRGRTLYGSVVISCCKRVIVADPGLACKLFPVSIQMILQLCHMNEEDVDAGVVEPLMTELSALLRGSFPQLLASPCPKSEVNTCTKNSIKALEQVMLPSFQGTWSISLKTLVICLQLVDDQDELVVQHVVEKLLKLRNECGNDVDAQRSVEAAVGSLIEAVGIKQFWKCVNWTPLDDSKGKCGVDLANTWLLSVMKTASSAASGRQPRLKFFQKKILDLARQCAMTPAKPSERASFDRWVVGLWSLFPSFCRNPSDVAEHLEKLIPTLVKAMEDSRFPQLLGMTCLGLETLAVNMQEKWLMDEGTLSEETRQEKEMMENASTLLIPVLFKSVERLNTSDLLRRDQDPEEQLKGDVEVPKENPSPVPAASTTQAIARLAGLAPAPFLEKLFRKLIRRLLEETQAQAESKEKLCTLLNLAQALVASKALDDSSVSLLYRTTKPLIRSDEHGSKAQKLSYKVLAEICRCHHSYVSEEKSLKELVDLLAGAAVTSHVSSRAQRLKCMGILVDGFEDGRLSDLEIVTKMTGELLLCLKDSKAKTRDTAYQVLISLANATGNITDFLRVVTAALAAETTHMRSAAVMAASRLVFEFAREDNILQSALPSLLKTVLILFEEQSREVIKSAVGFVRVCVAAMDADQLRPLLKDVVGSLLKYQRGKDRFRAKIKIILKKLVRLYGYDTLMPFVPETEARLLVHMRKIDERAARRKAANRADGRIGPQDYDAMVGSDEEDSDDGRTLMTGATGLTRKSAMTKMTMKSAAQSQTSKTRASSIRSTAPMSSSLRLPSENDGEVVNILSLKEKSVRFGDDADESDSDDGGMMEFDEAGRLVVLDELDAEGPVLNDDEDEEYTGRSNKRRRLDRAKDSESVKTGNTEARDGKKRDRGKNVRQLGAAYKSRKAGGDVKKKGQKYEPYAYVPLDGRSYSKKNRRRAVEQMATVVPQGGKRKRN